MNEDWDTTAEQKLETVHSMTNSLNIGLERVEVGQSAVILACHRIWNHINVELSLPGKGNGCWFSMTAFFEHDRTAFMVLKYPDEMTIDLENPPEIMMELANGKTAMPVSNDKLIQLVPRYLSLANSSEPIDFELMSALIGPVYRRKEE